MRRGIDHAIRAGELLVEARALVNHGEWLPWVEKHCAISVRMAQNYMRIAKNKSEIEAKAQSISYLTIPDALKLLDCGRGAPELQHAVERGDVSVSAAADIATESPEQQREIVARGEREILDAAKAIHARRLSARRKERIARVAALADPGPLPRGQWPLIYADPAQRYEEISDTAGRAIEWQYETLSLEQLCALPVRDIVAPSAVLLFWTPATLQFQAPVILEAWGGFRIRSEIVWVKTGGPGLHAIGPGTYVRYEHEHLLIATRGDIPTPPENARPPSVLYAPRREHSRKPDKAYQIIEQMYPELPKIELFARGAARPGWAVWGNEAQSYLTPPQPVEPPEDSRVDPFPESLNETPQEMAKRRKDFLKNAGAALGYGQVYDGPVDGYVIKVATACRNTWAKMVHSLKHEGAA
jgi:N6-adenosine-specific RNA methylase IME4